MLLSQHELTQPMQLQEHELLRSLEGSDVTWAKMQRSSGKLFELELAQTEPTSSMWLQPTTDPLRVWPDAYDPSVDNSAWANDPFGPWSMGDKRLPGFCGGIKKDTGLDPAVFNYAFMALYDHIPCGESVSHEPLYGLNGDDDPDVRKRNFYAALKYIHQYPTYGKMTDVLGVSSYLFSTQVAPAIFSMSQHAHFMDFNLRFWDYNHTADFTERVLWSVDGYPVEVCASQNRFVRRLTKSGKYKTHVVKGDMMVLLGPGFLCDNCFGYPGTRHDSPMWMDNFRRRRRLRPWEYGLGDKAYIGCPEILTEWKNPSGGTLTAEKVEWNLLLQFYRARNEHLISELKQSRATLSQKWRGSFALLRAIVDLSVQLEALQERMRGPRYDGFGPWPVCPSEIAEVLYDAEVEPAPRTAAADLPRCGKPTKAGGCCKVILKPGRVCPFHG